MPQFSTIVPITIHTILAWWTVMHKAATQVHHHMCRSTLWRPQTRISWPTTLSTSQLLKTLWDNIQTPRWTSQTLEGCHSRAHFKTIRVPSILELSCEQRWSHKSKTRSSRHQVCRSTRCLQSFQAALQECNWTPLRSGIIKWGQLRGGCDFKNE